MAGKKEKSFFWASYADLMTSMFFIMLMLFVTAIVKLSTEQKTIIEERAKWEAQYKATKKDLDKIREIETATKNLDPAYFAYYEEFKKHKLTIDVHFDRGDSRMDNIPKETQDKLRMAGLSVKKHIEETRSDSLKIQYLLIIEGQASKDAYSRNYELSYERALALKKFWEKEGIVFTEKDCEVLICGSGDGVQSGTGLMRESDESLNQRFLIHILPKPGMVETVSKSNI